MFYIESTHLWTLIVHMIPDVDRILPLLLRVDLSVSVDDYVARPVLVQYLLIHIQDIFMKNDRHIYLAFIRIALGADKALLRDRCV